LTVFLLDTENIINTNINILALPCIGTVVLFLLDYKYIGHQKYQSNFGNNHVCLLTLEITMCVC
jgi:hypothetical protein